MKNTLKNVGLFIAGSYVTCKLVARMVAHRTNYPYEGAVVYEDDSIKVTRVTEKESGKVDLATIMYKKHSKNGEES